MHQHTIYLPFLRIDFYDPIKIDTFVQLPDFRLILSEQPSLSDRPIKQKEMWVRFTSETTPEESFHHYSKRKSTELSRNLIINSMQLAIEMKEFKFDEPFNYVLTDWKESLKEAILNAASKQHERDVTATTSVRLNKDTGEYSRDLNLYLGNGVWFSTIPEDGDAPEQSPTAFYGTANLFGIKRHYRVYRGTARAPAHQLFRDFVDPAWIHNEISFALAKYRLVDKSVGSLTDMYNHSFSLPDPDPAWINYDHGPEVMRRRVAKAYYQLFQKCTSDAVEIKDFPPMLEAAAKKIDCFGSDMALLITGDATKEPTANEIFAFYENHCSGEVVS